MKLESYLQTVEEIPPTEIEKLINLSRVAVADIEDLHWDSRDLLTGLIAEKVQLGIRLRRARLGMDMGNVPRRPPRFLPTLWGGFC